LITDVNGDTTTVVTGTDGSWIATNLPAGNAVVDVDESNLPANLDNTVTTIGSDNETVTVVVGTTTPTLDDGYTLSDMNGSLSGVVFEDTSSRC